MPKPHSPDSGATFDLGAIETELRRDPGYHKNGHAARTLVRVSDLRLVLVAMKAGSEIAEHRANETASVQGLTGQLRVRLPDHTVNLHAGQVLVMAPGLQHGVKADDDSAFLLTLGWQGAS